VGGPPSPRGMGATFEHRPQPAVPGAVSPRGSGPPPAGGLVPSLAPVPSHTHAPGSASPKSSPRGEEQKTDKFKPTPTVPYEMRLLTHPERIHPSEEEILRIDGINIYAIERGHLQLIHEKTALVFHRTK
jgi:hypothetical protein